MTNTITRVESPEGAHPAAVYGQDEAGNYYVMDQRNGDWWRENIAEIDARKVRANGGKVLISNAWRKGENWMMRQKVV